MLGDHGHVGALREGWQAYLQALDPDHLSQAGLRATLEWGGVTTGGRGAARVGGPQACVSDNLHFSLSWGQEGLGSHQARQKGIASRVTKKEGGHPPILCQTWAGVPHPEGAGLPATPGETCGLPPKCQKMGVGGNDFPFHQEKEAGCPLYV